MRSVIFTSRFRVFLKEMIYEEKCGTFTKKMKEWLCICILETA